MAEKQVASNDDSRIGPWNPIEQSWGEFILSATPEQLAEAGTAYNTWRLNEDSRRLEGSRGSWKFTIEGNADIGDIEDAAAFYCSGSKKRPHAPSKVGDAMRGSGRLSWYLAPMRPGERVQVRPDGGERAQSEGKRDWMKADLAVADAERAAELAGDVDAVWTAQSDTHARLLASGDLLTAGDHDVIIFRCRFCPLDVRVRESGNWSAALSLYLERARAEGVATPVDGWTAVPVRVLERTTRILVRSATRSELPRA